MIINKLHIHPRGSPSTSQSPPLQEQARKDTAQPMPPAWGAWGWVQAGASPGDARRRRVVGALSPHRASLLFANWSAGASPLPLSSPCPSSSPLVSEGNGLLLLHPPVPQNSCCPWRPVPFPPGAFPGHPDKGRSPRRRLCSPPSEHLPRFGFRRRRRSMSCPSFLPRSPTPRGDAPHPAPGTAGPWPPCPARAPHTPLPSPTSALSFPPTLPPEGQMVPSETHLLGFYLGSQLALFHPPACYVPTPPANWGGGE